MKIIVSAGGTGGHIYPALAIIDKFKEKEKDLEVLYIGTHNRMEKDIVPARGIKYEALEIYGFSKSDIKRDIKNIFLIKKAYNKCLRIMQEFKPDIVIGVGGYVTFPVIKAANKLGIKTFIHEQNSIPGKSNIALSKKVDLIGVSFEDSKKYFKNSNIAYTGNPCGEAALKTKNISKASLKLSKDKKLVLVVAGSLGSSTLNRTFKDFLKKVENEDYEVVYITGNSHYDAFVKNEIFPKNVKVLPYLDNLAGLMKNVDLMITRAGASTISEILSLGVPAIFVPSPYVANNHQYFNAFEIKNKNAALMIEEKDLNSDSLLKEISELFKDTKRYNELKKNVKELGTKNSSETIYNLIKGLIK